MTKARIIVRSDKRNNRMRVLETEVKTPHKTFMKTVSVPVDMDAESIKREIAFQIKQDLKNIQKPDLSTTFEVEIDGN